MEWRYVQISAQSKTNTLALPNPMADDEYSVILSPIFNGHLVDSIYAGSLSGSDGRTTTTVQVSMNCTPSETFVGVVLFILGYVNPA